MRQWTIKELGKRKRCEGDFWICDAPLNLLPRICGPVQDSRLTGDYMIVDVRIEEIPDPPAAAPLPARIIFEPVMRGTIQCKGIPGPREFRALDDGTMSRVGIGPLHNRRVEPMPPVEETLQPCAHCGGEYSVRQTHHRLSGPFLYSRRCCSIGCGMVTEMCQSPEEADRRWNRRA